MNESRGNGKPPKYIYVPQRIMMFVRNAPFRAEYFLFPYFYSKKLITFCKCVLYFFLTLHIRVLNHSFKFISLFLHKIQKRPCQKSSAAIHVQIVFNKVLFSSPG